MSKINQYYLWIISDQKIKKKEEMKDLVTPAIDVVNDHWNNSKLMNEPFRRGDEYVYGMQKDVIERPHQ